MRRNDPRRMDDIEYAEYLRELDYYGRGSLDAGGRRMDPRDAGRRPATAGYDRGREVYNTGNSRLNYGALPQNDPRLDESRNKKYDRHLSKSDSTTAATPEKETAPLYSYSVIKPNAVFNTRVEKLDALSNVWDVPQDGDGNVIYKIPLTLRLSEDLTMLQLDAIRKPDGLAGNVPKPISSFITEAFNDMFKSDNITSTDYLEDKKEINKYRDKGIPSKKLDEWFSLLESMFSKDGYKAGETITTTVTASTLVVGSSAIAEELDGIHTLDRINIPEESALHAAIDRYPDIVYVVCGDKTFHIRAKKVRIHHIKD